MDLSKKNRDVPAVCVCRCDFDFQCYLINRALQNESSPRLITSSLVNSDSCRYKQDLRKFIAFVGQ